MGNKIMTIKKGHYGQIITTRKNILEYIKEIESDIVEGMVLLIFRGLDENVDSIRLYSVCSKLYFLSKLVYLDESKIKKLEEIQYMNNLFNLMELEIDDVIEILRLNNFKTANSDQLKEILDCYNILKLIWCREIACPYEQIYISELAYAYDYVVKRKGKLPKPEFQGKCSLFPTNYENYNYGESYMSYFSNID